MEALNKQTAAAEHRRVMEEVDTARDTAAAAAIERASNDNGIQTTKPEGDNDNQDTEREQRERDDEERRDRDTNTGDNAGDNPGGKKPKEPWDLYLYPGS